MSISMFIVGFIIFALYLFFLIWNISYNTKKQKKENYPRIDDANTIDYDGGGNWGRIPEEPSEKN